VNDKPIGNSTDFKCSFTMMKIKLAPPPPPNADIKSDCMCKKRSKAFLVTGHGGPWGFETSRLSHFLDSRHTVCGEIVSLMRRSVLPPRKIPGIHFFQGMRVIARLDGVGKLKNPITSPEIEPATFRLAA
jgi:hypothetical protein